MQDFLPVTREDMESRGWEEVDFVYVTGDAYVDHPSFGSAIIGRLLESRGYRVGMIPQPDWRKKESIQVFGEPRLGFLVTAGNMDSSLGYLKFFHVGNILVKDNPIKPVVIVITIAIIRAGVADNGLNPVTISNRIC